ncbi:MAG: protein-export chaperone SecB [Gammaproteobacteria bacterium]|nr:protein-export chaperone SecB [Gammaproteobacteria bacterium]|tara:strand:- start:18642 stop:19079 length:438 start_codon:yes stop_codon:yes gene_type:complete
MAEKQIKFTVNRIYAKDISLESPEAPGIFNELKMQPKVGFNLKTNIVELDSTTYEITLDINVKAETDEKAIYLVELKQSGIFGIEGADEDLKNNFLNVRCPEIIFPYAMESVSTLIQKSGFPPIFFAPIDFNALHQQELAKQKNT